MSENKPRRRAQAARAAKKSASRKSGLSRVMLVAMMMVMVAVVSIGGTLAWLQDETETITNTFTTSDITITIEETDTDKDEDNNPLTNSYQMIPGGTIAKDPKVTVGADSEPCWVFVKLEKSANFETYMEYTIDETVWTKVAADVYARKAVAGDSFDVIKDNKVTVKSTVTKEQMENLIVTKDDPDTEEDETVYNYPTLKVTAYAIQQANLTGVTGTEETLAADAARAWELFNAN